MALGVFLVTLRVVLAGAASYDLTRANPGRRITKITQPWHAVGLFVVGSVFLLVGSADLLHHIGWWALFTLIPFGLIYATPISCHNRSTEAATNAEWASSCQPDSKPDPLRSDGVDHPNGDCRVPVSTQCQRTVPAAGGCGQHDQVAVTIGMRHRR